MLSLWLYAGITIANIAEKITSCVSGRLYVRIFFFLQISWITHKIKKKAFHCLHLHLQSWLCSLTWEKSVDNGCNRSVRRTNTKLIPSLTGILPIRLKTLSNQSIYRSRKEPLKSQKKGTNTCTKYRVWKVDVIFVSVARNSRDPLV